VRKDPCEHLGVEIPILGLVLSPERSRAWWLASKRSSSSLDRRALEKLLECGAIRGQRFSGILRLSSRKLVRMVSRSVARRPGRGQQAEQGSSKPRDEIQRDPDPSGRRRNAKAVAEFVAALVQVHKQERLRAAAAQQASAPRPGPRPEALGSMPAPRRKAVSPRRKSPSKSTGLAGPAGVGAIGFEGRRLWRTAVISDQDVPARHRPARRDGCNADRRDRARL